MPEPKGKLATPVGIDAAGDLYAFLIDPQGHLQIDIITSGLPTGAATEATLANIKTAVEKIDDLRNALGSVDTDDLQVNVKTLPTLNVGVRRGTHEISSYSAVPGDTDLYTLLSIDGQGVVQWLNLVSDNKDTYMFLTLDGHDVHCADIGGQLSRKYIYAYVLQHGNQEDSLWRVINYDEANTRFGIALKRELWFASSLRVQYRAASNTAKVGISCGYNLVT